MTLLDDFLPNDDEEYIEPYFAEPSFTDKLYCPVCKKTYPFTEEHFYIQRRRGYNQKKSGVAVCKQCRRRNRTHGSGVADEGENTRIGRVNLDPTFGLNLYDYEAAIALEHLAEGSSLNYIQESIMKWRYEYLKTKELVSKKTFLNAAHRLTPIILRYTLDCCKPRRVDSEIHIDTFYFTRLYNKLDRQTYRIIKSHVENYVTIAVGGHSYAIYGFGVSSNKADSCDGCVKMAMRYTSAAMIDADIKFDGDSSIKLALLKAGVPQSNLISIPKSLLKSHINKAEGLIKILREKGLKKRRFSNLANIFVRVNATFINWNLFETHTLRDGTLNTTVREHLRINAPQSWHELIQNSWRYILSSKELFETYYPRFKRGPKKHKEVS